VTCLRQWKNKLIETGFQALVFEDAMEVVIDQLNSLGTQEPLVVPQLEANMRDPMLSPMIVMLLRMLTSAEIQRRSDFFGPFIMVRRGVPAQSPCAHPAILADES
jgi:ubiquitin thioesterase protein OTUB1